MAVNTTFDFDQMLSNAREAYGEELLRMADDGLDFVFTYSDNVAPSSSAGKLIAKTRSAASTSASPSPVRWAPPAVWRSPERWSTAR